MPPVNLVTPSLDLQGSFFSNFEMFAALLVENMRLGFKRQGAIWWVPGSPGGCGWHGRGLVVLA